MSDQFSDLGNTQCAKNDLLTRISLGRIRMKEWQDYSQLFQLVYSMIRLRA